MKVGTELHIVFANLPGKIVEDLVVTVEAMARHAAGRPELGHSADQDDGQSRIERSTVAISGGGRRAKPDRTGMKILVRREESFGEAVPAIAKFIHFVRAEHVVIGKRHQLHARRRERVEAGQLPARRGQGQGKRLHTVSEEIPAGEQVVRVKAVVDLGDKARKFVE